MLFKCCKLLYVMTEDPSIWHSICRGMHSLMPKNRDSPYSGLSASDLRQKVITACHLDQRWRRADQTLTKLETTPWHPDILQAKLLAGGEWVLNLRANGELHIQRLGSPTSAFIVPAPNIKFQYIRMEWFPSEDDNKSNLATINMFSWDKQYVNTPGIFQVQ